MLVINPRTNTASTFDVSPDSGAPAGWSFAGLVRGRYLIGVPLNNNDAIIIDSATNTSESIPVAEKSLWAGGVTANDGLVYGIPHHAESVVVIGRDCSLGPI